MKVEIWSDVMCPFCYIGKRRFEEALGQFAHADEVEVSWKSFQLNPDMVTDPSISIHQYLADAKGWNLDYAKQMAAQVTEMAAGVGLTYNMDNAVVANSFNAHRFSHLATANGLGNEAEEALFKAYFTDGKNTDDKEVLIDLGLSIGLKAGVLEEVLSSNKYAEGVKEDIEEARRIGVRGVPFFVFDRKYAVSGAQPMELFLQTLEKAREEF